MKNITIAPEFEMNKSNHQTLSGIMNDIHSAISTTESELIPNSKKMVEKSEILIITSYPPRECGIATYSQDLIKALRKKFNKSLTLKVCALETGDAKYLYPEEVKYTLNTSIADEYEKLALTINNDPLVKIVLIQHEFGFYARNEQAFLQFIAGLTKPVVTVFHTVLPHPNELLKLNVVSIVTACKSVIVMTNTSADILMKDYNIPREKIAVIAHGTHLVPHLSKKVLKEKYELKGRKVLCTFGLLSSGKGIKTTLEALPAIIKQCPEVIFLVIGKTHPEVVKTEGEKYREMLEDVVDKYGLHDHVRFINKYLQLSELLEYLQLTDIYLFTANDPNQAVSGTFAYAMSCACPIISTPIPHAREVLTKDTGIIFDFRNSEQLADAVILLLNDESLRLDMSTSTLQKIVFTAWENSAVAHAFLFEQISTEKIRIKFNNPTIKLDHLEKMTTDTGIIQFSKINQPDLSTGYTLDDNARALIAMCMYYKLAEEPRSLTSIRKYLNFIKHCQQPDGTFLNYTDKNNKFTDQNKEVNLDDSNGRAIWALGYTISLIGLLPADIISAADKIIQKTLPCLETMHSTRAIAFSIKGLYYYQSTIKSSGTLAIIKTLANRMVGMYQHESSKKWDWFEGYLTYANSILPEALLYAWILTGDTVYKEIAVSSFDFLLTKTFNENGIEVISNKNWLLKGQKAGSFGEQPIDVAYTVMTLSSFYNVFQDESYLKKIYTAFNWFLGDNRLHQIIYNPCTGGCYDGLEESNVNLNQGAESTVSYLMARLTIEQYSSKNIQHKTKLRKHIKVHLVKGEPVYSTDHRKQAEPAVPVSSFTNLHLE